MQANIKTIIKNIIYCTLFILSLILISCNIFNPSDKGNFGVYLLEDKTLTMRNTPWDSLMNMPQDSLPFLSENDIDLYDWSSQLIYLKDDKTFLQEMFDDTITGGLKYNGCPFFVRSGTQTLYSGFVYHSMHGYQLQHPKISFTGLYYYPDNIFCIERPYDIDDDPRSLPEVKEALIDAGIYHAGIHVELDTDYGMTFHTISGDSMEAEYRVKISNQDRDALYVLDPEKQEGWMYQFFCTPPVLFDSLANPVMRSRIDYVWPSPDTSDYANLDHYTLLLPGQSIKRTIRRGIYTNVLEGDYYVGVHHAAPVYTMTRSKRNKTRGRIWLGSTDSEGYKVKIEL